jgi:hypothetical protein
MRRALALALTAAALSGAGTLAPASADPKCEPVTGEAGVCYQHADCPRCTPHVIVDPYCADHRQTIWCRTINGVYVDSDHISIG